MQAIRIKKHLNSEILHLTGLEDFVDKDVEVIILADDDTNQKKSISPANKKRKPGSAKGLLTIAPDFHLPLGEEEIEAFYQ